MTIWHTIYVYQGDSPLKQRQDLFFASIEQANTDQVQFVGGVSQPWSYSNWLTEPIRRDSTDLGDTRRKPYLKDMFDIVADKAAPDDWLLFSNGDCSVTPGFYEELAKLRATAVEYQRLDVENEPANLEELFANANAPYVPGIDGLALRANFYREFKDCLPDFIIGEPWWDPAYSWILRQLVPVRRLTHRLYHPKHDQLWDVAEPGPAGAHNYDLMRGALELGHVAELNVFDRAEKSDTAIITCLFGNCPQRLHASLKGLEEQLKQDLFADHYLIELLEPGQQTRLPDGLKSQLNYLSVIGGDENQDLFQKEALFNLAWKKAKAAGDYDYYIFTDADIYAEDRSWLRQIRHKLREDPRRAVHGYRLVQDSVDPTFSFCSLGSIWTLGFQTDLPINPGLCWGFHRKMLEMGDGFNSYCLECAGDSALVTEYLNHPEAQYDTSLWEWPWYQEIHRVLGQRALLDAVPIDLVHVHHGPAAKRHYNEVRRALSRLKPIPELVKLDGQGLLAWLDPQCPERDLLKLRAELSSDAQAEQILAKLGLLGALRDNPPLELPLRPLPDWPSETPSVLLQDSVESSAPQAANTRRPVFCPSRVFRETFHASWCDNVERPDSDHIPIGQDKEQPRLRLQGLAGCQYIIGLTALQPNWVPIDVTEWNALHLSVFCQGPAGDVVIQLVSQDGQGVEHESREIKLFARGLKVGQEQSFELPLGEFEGPENFDITRVRTVKYLGYGSFCLEVFDVYFLQTSKVGYTESLEEWLNACGGGQASLQHFKSPQTSEGISSEAVLSPWLPFSDILRLASEKRPPDSFAHYFRLPIKEGAKKGEIWLLTAWIRSVDGLPGNVVHMVEMAEEPYSNLLYAPLKTNIGWQQVWLPFEISEDFAPNALRYQLFFEDGPQVAELGGIALFQFSPPVYRHLLPDSRHVKNPPVDEGGSWEPDDYHLERSGSDDDVAWRLPPVLQQGFESVEMWGEARKEIQQVEGQAFAECLELSTQDQGGVLYALRGECQPGEIIHIHFCAQGDQTLPLQLDLLHEDESEPFAYRHCLARPAWSPIQFSVLLPSRLRAGAVRLRIEGAGHFRLGPMACWTSDKPGLPLASGSCSDEGWKEQAQARIIEHRQATLAITVRDAQGRLIPDCRIETQQIGHKFGFGTAVDEGMIRGSDPVAERYKSELLKLGFNTATLERELSWPVWQERNPLEKSETIQVLRWLLGAGFQVRGHFLVSGDWLHLPPQLKNSGDVFQDILERVQSALSFPDLSEKLFEWDLFNEPFWHRGLLSVVDEHAVPEWFKRAAQLAPECRFVVNQDRLLAAAGFYPEVVESTRGLMERLARCTQAKLGLGIECHLRGLIPTPQDVLRILERLSGRGWDLRVTELDLIDGGVEAFDDFLLALFSVPALTGISIWNFWDEVHWHGDALLFDKDWGLKPKGEVLLSYMQEKWRSQHTLRTNFEGQAVQGVFKGRHQVLVRHHLGECSVEVDVDQDTKLDLTIGSARSEPGPHKNGADIVRLAGPADFKRLHLIQSACDDVIWQDSWELKRYIEWLKQFGVRRYLEIGSWTGRLLNLLHRELAFETVAACDIGWAEKAGLELQFDPEIQYLRASSWSQEFREWRTGLGLMDVVFIDGDHSYEGVKRDFEINRTIPHRFLVFHDIYDRKFGEGPTQLWQELEGYKFEIVSPSSNMGIGIWSLTEDPCVSLRESV